MSEDGSPARDGSPQQESDDERMQGVRAYVYIYLDVYTALPACFASISVGLGATDRFYLLLSLDAPLNVLLWFTIMQVGSEDEGDKEADARSASIDRGAESAGEQGADGDDGAQQERQDDDEDGAAAEPANDDDAGQQEADGDGDSGGHANGAAADRKRSRSRSRSRDKDRERDREKRERSASKDKRRLVVWD